MPRYAFERLSAQDNSFLLFEEPGLYMHVSSTQIFELGPLAVQGGGVDYERIRRFIGSVLHRIPRYRQKLAWTPLEGRPVWIDDPEFDLGYHVRHTALPRPGSDAQLKKLAGRVMAQHLDRERPLWELWVVEGLSDDRFALIGKIHHCMIDGMSGMDISVILQSTDPNALEPEEAPDFIPRPAPSPSELLREAVKVRLGAPLRALRGWRHFQDEAEDVSEEISARLRGGARDLREPDGGRLGDAHQRHRRAAPRVRLVDGSARRHQGAAQGARLHRERRGAHHRHRRLPPLPEAPRSRPGGAGLPHPGTRQHAPRRREGEARQPHLDVGRAAPARRGGPAPAARHHPRDHPRAQGVAPGPGRRGHDGRDGGDAPPVSSRWRPRRPRTA